MILYKMIVFLIFSVKSKSSTSFSASVSAVFASLLALSTSPFLLCENPVSGFLRGLATGLLCQFTFADIIHSITRLRFRSCEEIRNGFKLSTVSEKIREKISVLYFYKNEGG